MGNLAVIINLTNNARTSTGPNNVTNVQQFKDDCSTNKQQQTVRKAVVSKTTMDWENKQTNMGI